MNIKDQQANAGERDRTDEPAPGQPIGQASGQHQGLHHPDDDQHVKEALGDADLSDFGESAEDSLRDRGGRGLPNPGEVGSGDEEQGAGYGTR